jgi:hypothetical protein
MKPCPTAIIPIILWMDAFIIHTAITATIMAH